MVSDKPRDDRCAEEVDGGYCEGWKMDNGSCQAHGGYNYEQGAPAPENNGRAEKHGMTADGGAWFERHREEVEDEVKHMVQAWMDKAPFGWENIGNVNLLVEAAINECQLRQGNQYIRENGFITQETRSAGENVYQQDVENPAFLAKSRLQKDTVRILKETGVLDSPAKQQADAVESSLGELARQHLED